MEINSGRAVAITTTTIHSPKGLQGYCANAKNYGHERVFFIIAGDKKTPEGVPAFCTALQREFGYEVQYLDVADQEKILRPFPSLAQHLPYNSLSRRNVALLQAYRQGADVIVTIDDDNFSLAEQDFVGAHSIVGQQVDYTEIQASSGWYNVCELLVEKRGLPFYHRGFPLSERWQESKVKVRKANGRVVVNAGLWLESPDLDAVTWLDLPIEVVRYGDHYPQGIGLAPGTWSPFNSQNTALAREVLPAYFLSPFVGRYDDVWASYIVKCIADHLGDAISFGRPLVRQMRNPHNYFVDFDKERFGMELTPAFTNWLQGLNIKGKNYAECFADLSNELERDWQEIFATSNESFRPFVEKFVEGLAVWRDVHATMPSKVAV